MSLMCGCQESICCRVSVYNTSPFYVLYFIRKGISLNRKERLFCYIIRNTKYDFSSVKHEFFLNFSRFHTLIIQIDKMQRFCCFGDSCFVIITSQVCIIMAIVILCDIKKGTKLFSHFFPFNSTLVTLKIMYVPDKLCHEINLDSCKVWFV